MSAKAEYSRDSSRPRVSGSPTLQVLAVDAHLLQVESPRAALGRGADFEEQHAFVAEHDQVAVVAAELEQPGALQLQVFEARVQVVVAAHVGAREHELLVLVDGLLPLGLGAQLVEDDSVDDLARVLLFEDVQLGPVRGQRVARSHAAVRKVVGEQGVALRAENQNAVRVERGGDAVERVLVPGQPTGRAPWAQWRWSS